MVAAAVIPARGGSKRIPRKNIRPFAGRPMLAWPIGVAVSSGLFDRVIVSTEDAEIAEVALQAGAEVPFMRPRELADDHASTAAVMQHAASWLGDQGADIDECCCIYPTTPFLTADDLAGARELLTTPGVGFVLAVARYDHPVERAMVTNPAGRVGLLWPQHAGTRSQDLAGAFHDAGQFCWGETELFQRGVPILSGDRTAPWYLPRWRAVDIDTEDDWRLAERLHAASIAEDF